MQIASLPESEQVLIADELERLYQFQGRRLDADQKAKFVEQFARMGIPCGAIVQGLRDLSLQKLAGPITMPMMVDYARAHVEDETLRAPCRECSRDGFVTMKDERGYRFALACSCAKGQLRGGLVTWNGQLVQESNGRTLWKV